MVIFFNDAAATEIYTLSLHDALPISDDKGASVLQFQLKVAVNVGHCAVGSAFFHYGCTDDGLAGVVDYGAADLHLRVNQCATEQEQCAHQDSFQIVHSF